MEIIKKYKFLSVFLLVFIIFSCASWQENYGKLRILREGRNEVTIQDLIDKWDDYTFIIPIIMRNPMFDHPWG